MTDQCGKCMLRGNIKECKAAPCNHHENWYAIEQQKRIDELESDNAELKALAYMVDQRNDQGEGATITYKSAYESVSEQAKNATKANKKLREENKRLKESNNE